jgi:hypothetical protein
VRVENLKDDAVHHIEAILARVKKDYIIRTYGVVDWQNHEVWLSLPVAGTRHAMTLTGTWCAVVW